MYLILLSVKQVSTKYHFLSLWSDTTWDCTQVANTLPPRPMTWLIGLACRVFTNGPGDLGSIPGCVIPKTLEMVLDASLLNKKFFCSVDFFYIYQDYLNLIFYFWILVLIGIIPYSRFTGFNYILYIYTYIYIYIYLLLLFYSFESFSHKHQLMVFHWSLRDSYSPQVSRTLLSILANLNSSVILKVFLFPILLVSSSLLWWLYQVHRLQSVSPSLTCSIVFQSSCKVQALISLFTFLHFHSVVYRDGKVHNSESSLTFVDYHYVWPSGRD